MSLGILVHLWGQDLPKENYIVLKSHTMNKHKIMMLHTSSSVPAFHNAQIHHPSLAFPAREMHTKLYQVSHKYIIRNQFQGMRVKNKGSSQQPLVDLAFT